METRSTEESEKIWDLMTDSVHRVATLRTALQYIASYFVTTHWPSLFSVVTVKSSW